MVWAHTQPATIFILNVMLTSDHTLRAWRAILVMTLFILTLGAVALATLMPRPLQPLIPSAEGIAALLMNIFFATVGAAGVRLWQPVPIPHRCCAITLLQSDRLQCAAAEGLLACISWSCTQHSICNRQTAG